MPNVVKQFFTQKTLLKNQTYIHISIHLKYCLINLKHYIDNAFNSLNNILGFHVNCILLLKKISI